MDSDGPTQDKAAMVDPRSASIASRPRRYWHPMPAPSAILASLGLVGVTTLLAHAVLGVVSQPSLSLLYLVAVLVAAVRYGFWMGIGTSVLAFLAFNFFLVAPLYTLRVSEPADALTLLALLAAGATTGFLTGRLREEADAAASRARTLELLAVFAHDLGAAASSSEIEAVMARHLAALDDGRAAVLRAGAGGLEPTIVMPDGTRLDADALQAAERAWRRDRAEQASARGWGGSGFEFHPLGREHGVIGFARGASAPRFPDHDAQVRRAIIEQGRLALEKARLAHDAKAARNDAEREAMRAALLSSLSHDLKTPLATILGGISSLRELGHTMPVEARGDLLLAVEEEAQRLSRYVANLLHLTRMKAGLDLRLDWVDAVDAAHGAVMRARQAHAARRVAFSAPAQHPLIRADAVLLEQAVFNLVDNAARFSAPDGRVDVSVGREGNDVLITVGDEGPGIPASELAHVFEPFFRGSAGGTLGSGLGLAIVRGIVQAMAGTVEIESPRRDGKGVSMRIRLPWAPERAA